MKDCSDPSAPRWWVGPVRTAARVFTQSMCTQSLKQHLFERYIEKANQRTRSTTRNELGKLVTATVEQQPGTAAREHSEANMRTQKPAEVLEYNRRAISRMLTGLSSISIQHSNSSFKFDHAVSGGRLFTAQFELLFDACSLSKLRLRFGRQPNVMHIYTARRAKAQKIAIQSVSCFGATSDWHSVVSEALRVGLYWYDQ